MSLAGLRIAVLGGTGFVGRSVCERLVRAGAAAVVVPTRRFTHAQHLRTLPSVDVRLADVHDDQALPRALLGCDAVVNLVAILHGSAGEFDRVHVALPRRLGQTCQTLGIQRVVHVSALGVSDDAPSAYLRSKAGGERALRDAGLRLTVLRPSVIFGAHDQLLNLFATLQRWFPVMPLAGADAQLQPVWVEDVAAAVIASLERSLSVGQTIQCAGPEVMSLADLVRAAGRYAGVQRPVVPLPAALARLQALAMEYMPGKPLMTRDNLASLQVPNVAGPALPGLDALGITPAALASVAPAYLSPGAARRLDKLRSQR
jgi:NADH dehydrogenase